MAPGGTAVSPLHIPAWRDFPLRARLAALAGVPAFVDNDAKALALGEGWVGRRPGRRRLPGHGRVDGRGRRDRVVGAACWRGRPATPATSATWSSSPAGRPCACGGRGCLEAEASGPAIAAYTGARRRRLAPSRPPAGGDAGGPGRGLRRQPARPAAGGRGAARWRWATATTSSPPPGPRPTLRARLSFSQRRPHRPAAGRRRRTRARSAAAAVAWRLVSASSAPAFLVARRGRG